MTQKQTASIATSWTDHPIGIQAEGLEVEELSFPVQSKKKRKSRIKTVESNRSDCATADRQRAGKQNFSTNLCIHFRIQNSARHQLTF